MIVSARSIEDLSNSQIAAWDALVESSTWKTGFLSYGFSKAVNEVRGGVLVVHIAVEDGANGFLPLQMCRGRAWLGHSEQAGGALSDFFGVAGNLTRAIDPDELLAGAGLSSIRFGHALPKLCPFPFDDKELQVGLRLRAASFEEFESELLFRNRVFAKSVASRERKVERELGKIAFSWQSDDPMAALDKLIATKREQYRRTGVRDTLEDEWQRNLLKRLLTQPKAKTCEAILSTLYAGETWIASKLSLVCADTLHSWFSVYDRHHLKYGPGHLLWFRVIEKGCSEGIRIFDFGEGVANYKSEYGGELYDLSKGSIHRNNFGGFSERAFQSLRWRLRLMTARAGRQNIE